MNMTTGQFSDNFLPIMDGVTVAVKNYAYWLQKKYGKSYVIGPEVKGYEDTEEFPVLRYASVPIPGFDPYRIGMPKIDREFNKRLEHIEFDLVHAHSPFMSGQMAHKIASTKGIPLVATFHSKYREDFKSKISNEKLIELVVRRVVNFYESADVVWVPARNTVDVMKEYGYTGEVAVVPNGTDMEIPSPQEYKRYYEHGGRQFGLNDDDVMFLFVGQHRWLKNIRLILDALKIVSERGKQFTMVFVGKGPDRDEIEEVVSEYGLWPNVCFTGVIIKREEMKPIYARANLFLFPSLYDNAPLVMREAAAFQVPTVLVKGSTAAENVIDGENGFLIEHSAESFADRLCLLLDDLQHIKSVGVQAQKTIYISWEQVIDIVYKRYRSILENFSTS